MKTNSLLALTLVLPVLGVAAVPLAKLTVKAVDELGSPIQGARVTLTFFDQATKEGLPVDGLTDSTGLFSAESRSAPTLGGEVQKSGYYVGGFPFKPFREAKDGRWQPWNPTVESVLRKIEKPEAVYARRFRKLDIP